MGMSIFYGQPDDAASIATIHSAIDQGVNLIVTSDAYGNGANESLLGRALVGRREKALVCSKFGNLALAGGGDTLAAIEKFGVESGISYISTGGGAFLEFVEGKTLPAVAALEARFDA